MVKQVCSMLEIHRTGMDRNLLADPNIIIITIILNPVLRINRTAALSSLL